MPAHSDPRPTHSKLGASNPVAGMFGQLYIPRLNILSLSLINIGAPSIVMI